MINILQGRSKKIIGSGDPAMEKIGSFQYEPGTLLKSFEALNLSEESFNTGQLQAFVNKHTSGPALKARASVAERLGNGADDMQEKHNYFTLIDEDVVYAQGVLDTNGLS